MAEAMLCTTALPNISRQSHPLPSRLTALPLPGTSHALPSQAFYFSVVIENIRADFYFSSKLINCFVHGVVPIYWGAPSIADFFNISGIIEFETVQQVSPHCTCVRASFCNVFLFSRFSRVQLDDIVAGLTIEKWLGMLPAIQDNLNRAKRYGERRHVELCSCIALQRWAHCDPQRRE